MKKINIILATVFVISLLFSIDAHAFTANNWMGSIGGDKYISEISIPGTHDSGALYEPVTGTAKCQNFSVDEQLNMGVRYLDIRCREYKDSFVIHHGSVYQHLNFDDVINVCSTFLRNNPTETIIMSIKEEYNPEDNTKDFESVFNSYVNKNRSMWFLDDRIPTLNEARGKIVLVRRFGTRSWPVGINACGWRDNTTFTINNAVKLTVQDCYKVGSNDNKWNEISNLYTRSNMSNDKRELFLNYTSGYKPIVGVPNIRWVSGDINKRLLDYFNNGNVHGRYGISAIDFIDKDISSGIIKTNF